MKLNALRNLDSRSNEDATRPNSREEQWYCGRSGGPAPSRRAESIRIENVVPRWSRDCSSGSDLLAVLVELLLVRRVGELGREEQAAPLWLWRQAPTRRPRLRRSDAPLFLRGRGHVKILLCGPRWHWRRGSSGEPALTRLSTFRRASVVPQTVLGVDPDAARRPVKCSPAPGGGPTQRRRSRTRGRETVHTPIARGAPAPRRGHWEACRWLGAPIPAPTVMPAAPVCCSSREPRPRRVQGGGEKARLRPVPPRLISLP